MFPFLYFGLGYVFSERRGGGERKGRVKKPLKLFSISCCIRMHSNDLRLIDPIVVSLLYSYTVLRLLYALSLTLKINYENLIKYTNQMSKQKNGVFFYYYLFLFSVLIYLILYYIKIFFFFTSNIHIRYCSEKGKDAKQA